MNARSFEIQVNREFEETLDELRTVIRVIALQALSGIVLKTPVDTGRARANWFVTIGQATAEVTTEIDKVGSVTISAGGQEIANYKDQDGFPSIVIYNNLPYINRLENGYSGQAPAGMVAVTVAEIEASQQ